MNVYSKTRFELKWLAIAVVLLLLGAAAFTLTNGRNPYEFLTTSSASAATNRSATNCTSRIPAEGGQIWDCRFDSPSTLYFVSTGGKGHRFRYILACKNRKKLTNVKPDRNGGDSYKFIPSNKRRRLTLDNPAADKALRFASPAKPCTLEAVFVQYPENGFYDAKHSFAVAVLGTWNG